MAAFTAEPRIPYDPNSPLPQKGITSVLFFRLLKNAATDTGKKLAFQTEHSESIANEVSSTKTKDGSINVPAGATFEYSISSILAKNDPLAAMLKGAVIAGDVVECWEVAVDSDMTNAAGQYLATYMQGVLPSWEESKNSEENIAISTTLTVNQIPQQGYLDLTLAEQAAVQYAFRTLAEYEADSSAPAAPSAAAVRAADATITGVAEAGAVVTARLISGELLGSTVADQTDGDYIIAITPQAQGTVIKIVAKDAAGNVSPVTSVTVTA